MANHRGLSKALLGLSSLTALFIGQHSHAATAASPAKCNTLTSWFAHERNWPSSAFEDATYEGAPTNHSGAHESLDFPTIAAATNGGNWPCFSGMYDASRQTVAAIGKSDSDSTQTILVQTAKPPKLPHRSLGLVFTHFGVHLGMSLEDVMRIEGPGKTEIAERFVILRYRDPSTATLPAKHLMFAFRDDKLVAIAVLTIPE